MIYEIRTYRLKPGTLDDFVHVMRTQGVPLLRSFGITVVAAGPSLVKEGDWEEAYIIRAFADADERDRLEEAFYGSPEWHNGPRSAVLERIEHYHTVVIPDSDLMITWSED
ncbi:NIPSNAP family protein [Nonomuraea sp. NPDC050663]|uniref:NIPSNAP family protein n=1 Tax=Nonomuraea sp. NPDC050663 TaxID=3364370 RepID=UPI0037ADB94D